MEKDLSGTILDYLDWRGDLDFSSVPPCDIDYLIFSRMAYLPFETYPCLGLTVAEAVALFDGNARFLIEQDPEFAGKLAESRRFSSLRVLDTRVCFNKQRQEQFCAILWRMDEKTIVFGFRGTDATIVGWKEDFNMGFVTPVPSQKEALSYLKSRADVYKDDSIILCGHSKGGNIAEYAALMCPKSIQDRILKVSNFDGPGFDSAVVPDSLYEPIRDRYLYVVPQTSIIGVLLNHGITPTVVKSTNSGIKQHDLYSWTLLGNHFCTLEERNTTSRFLDATIKNWVCALDQKQRQAFVDVLFESLLTYDKLTFKQFRHDWRQSIPLVYEQIKDMDSTTRKMMGHLLGLLLHSATEAIPEVKHQD